MALRLVCLFSLLIPTLPIMSQSSGKNWPYQPAPPVLQRELGNSSYRWLVQFLRALQVPPAIVANVNGSIVLQGFTFTNTPGAGSTGTVSWTSGTVSYKGNIYQVAAGSINAIQRFIGWQLSTPNVFVTGAPLANLGPDGFIIGLNVFWGNILGVPSSGYFDPTLEVHSSQNNRLIIGSESVTMYNAEGNPVWALKRSQIDGMGNSAYGQFFVYDGTLTQGIGFQADSSRFTTLTPPINFNQLPPGPVKGERAIIQDSNSTTFNAVAAGGGANTVPVFFDGTNWRIG